MTATLLTDSNITATYAPNVPYLRQNGTTVNAHNGSQEVYIIGGSGNRGGITFSDDDAATWSVEHFVNAGATPHAMGCLAGWNAMSFTYLGDVVYFASQRGVGYTDDGGATVTYYNTIMPNAADNSIGVNGFSAHVGAVLAWNRSGTSGYLCWSMDTGVTFLFGNLPSGVTFVANAQWMLDDFVPPG